MNISNTNSEEYGEAESNVLNQRATSLAVNEFTAEESEHESDWETISATSAIPEPIEPEPIDQQSDDSEVPSSDQIREILLRM